VNYLVHTLTVQGKWLEIYDPEGVKRDELFLPYTKVNIANTAIEVKDHRLQFVIKSSIVSPTFANVQSFIEDARDACSWLTNEELRDSALPISGEVTVSGTLGSGDLTQDAWGTMKVSIPHSLDHGLFTFDISPLLWFMYENGTQVYTSTNIVSTDGTAIVTGNATKATARLEGRLCPRYQPNRGHLFSTALWTPNKTANGLRRWGLFTTENGVYFRLKSDGKLYAVLKSLGVETYEEEIDTSGVANFDVQKGNVYDCQYQWRGLGNYKFFINLKLVHTISNLGTLTALSMANPALPQAFESVRTTEDVSIHIGCCDTSSENGEDDKEQYGSCYAQAVATNGADKPVLCIHVPLLIGSVTNTRTVIITGIKATNTKKCFVKIWRTRDPTAITGATFVANGNGSFIQTDSTDMGAGRVRATAVTTSKLVFVSALSLEQLVSQEAVLSDHNHIDFTLVRGDYLVITNDSINGATDVVVEWGEEI